MTSAGETSSSPPSAVAPAPIPSRRAPRARPYLRLLWLIPSLAILGSGLWGYLNVDPGGVVERVKLRTKEGPVGQASEALRLLTGTYNLYLKIRTSGGELRTTTHENRAIGNGLDWPLPQRCNLSDLRYIDVWDEHTFRSDKNLDHINIDGQWASEGQTFRIELQGQPNQPPKWSLPMLAVGATLSALVLIRFVWDQVV